MNLKEILDRVDTERLYQHVLRLEGVKHPIDTPDKLREAARYIYTEMESYGLPVRTQEFKLDGWQDTFLNVEGWLGDEAAPAVVLINHYDNVYSDPGANDNAVSIAVMLEAARVLAKEEGVPTIRFVSATLEEGLPPDSKLKIRQSAQGLGLTDERHRYTTYKIAKVMKQHFELVGTGIESGKSHGQAINSATEQLKDQMPEALLEHLLVVDECYGRLPAASAIGVTGKIGSSRWVDEAVAMGKPIAFAICLDEIGTIYKHENSQKLPAILTYDMMQTFKVDAEKEIGDWAFVIADANSGHIAQAFCLHGQREDIDLPYAFFQMPSFDEIAVQFPQAFGSDHAPFWRAGIPAMFAFDTANWRNPFGHSMADTIDKLDFDHVTKICKATIATATDRTLRNL